MAMNTYADTPPAGGNEMGEMMGEGMGEAVPCFHVYAMPDGTFGVMQESAPAPEGLEPVQSMEEVVARLEEFAANPAKPEEEAQAMEAAKAGYARRANRPGLEAPGGIFGE